jgi:hypothetical protein
MKYEVYTGIKVTDDFNVFDFISTGKHGNILKRVVFTKTEEDDVYNLALGDVDDDNDLNDYAVTDNGDRNKVLATVVSIIGAYTKRFPDRWIIFRGITAERTRLYRMAIGLNYKELSVTYEIWGLLSEEVVLFAKDPAINAFVIRRKNS